MRRCPVDSSYAAGERVSVHSSRVMALVLAVVAFCPLPAKKIADIEMLGLGNFCARLTRGFKAPRLFQNIYVSKISNSPRTSKGKQQVAR